MSRAEGTLAAPGIIRNWRQWEMDERLAFYKRKSASVGGRMPTTEELCAWKAECDAHIERERERIMYEQGEDMSHGAH